jgi:hypothetical protein
LLGNCKTRTGKKELHYLQLLKCNGRILDNDGNPTDQICGGAITGEEKRKPLKNGTFRYFIYYHCSNTTKRCSQRDLFYMKSIRNKLSYRQEEIEKLFEPIFDSIYVSPELAQKMTKLLWDEHFEQEHSIQNETKELELKYSQIQARLDEAYDDKLNGQLSPEMWNKKRLEWELQKKEIEAQLM